MEREIRTQIKDAIVILRELNADGKIKQEAYYREKRLHDEASALGFARREGETIGMAKGEAIGMAKGEAIGMAKGEAIGMAKGEENERNRIIENLRKTGMTEEQINQIIGISL